MHLCTQLDALFLLNIIYVARMDYAYYLKRKLIINIIQLQNLWPAIVTFLQDILV